MASWLDRAQSKLSSAGDAIQSGLKTAGQKIKGGYDKVKDSVKETKRDVEQGIHHQMDDRICTFVSKSNPENPKAYRDCVDTFAYNRYARQCKEVMEDEDMDDQEKERKCNKYRWEYLMESIPMLKVPDREDEPALWGGVDDTLIFKYNPRTKEYDGVPPEDYKKTLRGSSARRCSAKRGSCRRGSRRVARRGSAARQGSFSAVVARRGSSRRGSCRRK